MQRGFCGLFPESPLFPSRHWTGSTCILLLSLTALLWACGDSDISVSIPVAAGAPGCSTSEAVFPGRLSNVLIPALHL